MNPRSTNMNKPLIHQNKDFYLLKNIFFIFSIFISACSSTPTTHVESSKTLLSHANFLDEIHVNNYPVKVWSRLSDTNTAVHVYIEGDGHAWNQRGRPSLDPTPKNPVGLKLAAGDSHPNVIYLSRPCQFIELPKNQCNFKIWTQNRFSVEIVKELLEILKSKIPKGQHVILIGYSGGANIAIQMLDNLKEVKGLLTVAGNLDDKHFSSYHSLPTSLKGANDRILRRNKHIPQLHISGQNDEIIPPSLTTKMLGDVSNSECVAVEAQANTSHEGPWVIPWDRFAQLMTTCSDK